MLYPWAIFSILAFIVASCGQGPPSIEETSLRVYTTTVPPPSIYREREFAGISIPKDNIILSFRIPGKLVYYPITLGEHVKAGDVIAKLDDTDYVLDVKKAEAVVIETKAETERTKEDFDRSRLLYEASTISKSNYEHDLAAYLSAKAHEEAAKTALDLTKKQLDYSTLTSPIDGDVSEVPATKFETVAAGQEIARIASIANIQMYMGIPESLVDQIKLNDPATILFDAIPDHIYHAFVSEIGIITVASVYPLKLTITDNDGKIRSGMAGVANIRFHNPLPYVTIPPTAVVSGPNGRKYVWVYDPKTQKVSKRFIEVVNFVPDGLEVTSGLEGGEIIVTKGVHELREGMKVVVL